MNSNPLVPDPVVAGGGVTGIALAGAVAFETYLRTYRR